MFNYNAAVRQLYNKEVVSLAILCDDQPSWRPTTFGHGRWGCRMELALALDAKFGPSGLRLLRKVRGMEDVKELRKFARFLKKAETIEEVRDYLK